MAKNNKILKVENLSVSYGKIPAIKNVSLEVYENEITVLFGANGAGKTSLLKAVLGIQQSNSGKILFMGQDITRYPTNKIVKLGISYVPEGVGILPLMTVKENLLLGALFFKGDLNKQLREVMKVFPILEKRLSQMAGTLSGGERQMLAISRALMSDPKLLLLDEPSLGLSPLMTTELFNIIVELKNSGHTILLSEQNAHKALQCSDRGYVFQTGQVILEGDSKSLLGNAEVQQAYLGIS